MLAVFAIIAVSFSRQTVNQEFLHRDRGINFIHLCTLHAGNLQKEALSTRGGGTTAIKILAELS